MKHVQECTFPPAEPTREEMMAYQYLVWKENEKLLHEKADLARRKELADASSARRAAYSFSSSGPNVTQDNRRSRPRINLMTDAERAVATRNLDSSIMTEDADGIPIPRTASGALMSLSTYLRATQPPEGDPRAALHRQHPSAPLGRGGVNPRSHTRSNNSIMRRSRQTRPRKSSTRRSTHPTSTGGRGRPQRHHTATGRPQPLQEARQCPG